MVVKEIKTTALNAKLKAAVMDEVETLAKLTHPNIVKYCDCFMDDVYINIVMEYCDAGDLSGLIEARKEKPFEEDMIMFNFVQVGSLGQWSGWCMWVGVEWVFMSLSAACKSLGD
jgi:serine/threonine protein kinase